MTSNFDWIQATGSRLGSEEIEETHLSVYLRPKETMGIRQHFLLEFSYK